MSKQKRIGTAFETAVSGFLAGANIPNRRVALAGVNDEGDLLSNDGHLVVECKGGHAAENASHNQIREWLKEAETERVNVGAHVAILARKTKGKGAASAGLWAVHVDATNGGRLLGPDLPGTVILTMTLEDFTRIYCRGERRDS